MANITILGSGGWGLALAVLSRRLGHSVTVWSPFPEELADIRRHGEHVKLLPGVAIPPDIALTSTLDTVQHADLVLLTVPSYAIAQTLEKLAQVLPAGALVANAGKGLDANTHRRFSEVITDALPQARVVVLSGPSHAEEVARGIPTSVVSASSDAGAAERVQELLMGPDFRVYVHDDVVGVELGAALKNVMALAAGIIDGMGLGDNAKAALMTRGLAEMARLGVALGARGETFMGLSGMGDLIVTCGSMHSRNRRAGILIGQGCTVADTIAQVGTVEGYLAARAAYELAQEAGVEMPIAEECYRLCYEGRSPQDAIRTLMGRPARVEGRVEG